MSDWQVAFLRIVKLVRSGRPGEALRELDAFLRDPDDPGSRVEALMYRASLKKDLGELSAAKEDLLEAHEAPQLLPLRRQAIELALADIAEQIGDLRDAHEWYSRALAACLSGGDFASGVLLHRFLKFRGADLTSAERTLCLSVCQRSWELYSLPGSPDEGDLDQAAETIYRRECRLEDPQGGPIGVRS